MNVGIGSSKSSRWKGLGWKSELLKLMDTWTHVRTNFSIICTKLWLWNAKLAKQALFSEKMQPNFPSMIYSKSWSCRALQIAGPSPISYTLFSSSYFLSLIPYLSPAVSPLCNHSLCNVSSPFHLLPFHIFLSSSDLHSFCFSYLHLSLSISLLIMF